MLAEMQSGSVTMAAYPRSWLPAAVAAPVLSVVRRPSRDGRSG